MLTPGGTVVLAGAAKAGGLSPFTRLAQAIVLSRVAGQRLVPFLARIGYEDLIVLKELIEAGKVGPVIDRQYPLSEAPDAVRYLGSGQARAKVVINVG